MNLTQQEHKLGDVAEMIRGVTFGRSDGQVYPAKNYLPVLRAGNIQDRLIFENDLVWVPQSKISRSQLIKQNDIIMCTSSGSAAIVGKCAMSESDWVGSFGAFCIGIRPKSTKCVPSFLLHYLHSPAFTNWSKNSSGANIKNIRKSELEDFPIPLPPLPEQKRIAAILDMADAIRRKRQQAIKLAADFLRATFLDMFGDPVTNPKGWEQHRLGSICDVGSSNRVFVNELVEAGIPFYRGTEIGQLGDDNVVDPSLFITKEHYERLKAQSGVPRKGDLLLPSICPDGRIYLVKNEDPFYFKDGRVLWIKVDGSRINSKFLKNHLKLLFFIGYSKIASGTTFAELKIFSLKGLTIHVPPVEIQERFATIVETIEQLKTRLCIYKTDIDTLFASLTQRAFRGEL
jgi:type I restriction enzyme S subunit